MSDIYAIYGSGGYAREVMPLLRDYVNAKSKQKKNEFIFIDDSAEYEEMANGILVLKFKMLI